MPVSDNLTDDEDAVPEDTDIPEEGNVDTGDEGADEEIAPAQFADKHAETTDIAGDMNKPETIVDEAGNPSPEDIYPQDEDLQEAKAIEAVKDNVAIRYAELGKMIKEQRWFKARELAAELHEGLEYLAGADNEPFRRRIAKEAKTWAQS